MIFTLILSVILAFGLDWLCMILSGGTIRGLINGYELPGIIVILAGLIFLSGCGKDFCWIFRGSSSLQKLDLAELRKTEKSLDFANKVVFYICLFFILIGGIFFYLNIDFRTSLGPNLATILASLLYMTFLVSFFITLKAKLRSKIINIMAEEAPGTGGDKPAHQPKEIIKTVLQIVIALAVIIAMTIAVLIFHVSNEQEAVTINPLMFIDLPSFLYIFLAAFILLALSGNLKNFFKAFGAVFKKAKISVSQKSLYENAITSFRQIMIMTGIRGSLIGFTGTLFNLNDRSYLGINMFIAMIPTLYAIIICAVLMVVEARVGKLIED